jgi:hypothetical protein
MGWQFSNVLIPMGQRNRWTNPWEWMRRNRGRIRTRGRGVVSKWDVVEACPSPDGQGAEMVPTLRVDRLVIQKEGSWYTPDPRMAIVFRHQRGEPEEAFVLDGLGCTIAKAGRAVRDESVC